ncbi:MAG: tRNA pseudouridine(38-40) synthase TruA [Verrucomicrobia bacterium]|nr:tRNA pseudouridine(38-40) synthase TruA [Verrucomicrobiota bacterium]MBV9129432.1 tRNA pseudouridine(38-40) synthase TruA [Verrucomicrobiota bacterium]
MGPTLERLKLTVAYDGRQFSGWQSQRNRNAIQDHLERAFSQIASVPIKIQGAGRTDSGVHALGQVAHADVPRRKLNPATWRAAANARLPAEIRVLRCQRVSADFHAQYSALGKVYRYRIWNGPIFHPLEVARAWHVPQPLDFDLLRAASDRLTGTHDYASFAAKRGKAAETTTRTIHQIRFQRRKEHLTLEFHGNGFLYRMVRMLTGTIIRVASRKADLNWIAELLAKPGKSKTNCTAPAGGLYLVKVKYA